MDSKSPSDGRRRRQTNLKKIASKRVEQKRRKKKKLNIDLMGERRSGGLVVSSEIYAETNFRSCKNPDGMTISHFSFVYPTERDDTCDKSQSNKSIIDADGDLILERKQRGVIKIAHQDSTDLSLVGLQVWRGALILADFLFNNRWKFANKPILELGSGVGLTSIAAAIFSETDIICTDIDLGGILKVIQSNVDLNKSLMNNRTSVQVMELDFKKTVWSDELQKAVDVSKIIIAADVIYDNDITDCFVKTVERILDPTIANKFKDKEVYIAMEKRYVFTLADLDTMAPCYEYFLQCINEIRKKTNWKFEKVNTDFPKYFDYERSKDLVIMKLYL